MSDNEATVRGVIERWIEAIQRCDLDGILANHADDIVMYDVPPPYEGLRGMRAYRDSWPQFFDFLKADGVFELQELDITAADDVAFAYALVRCGQPKDFAEKPDNRLRITVGLRKAQDSWLITHEHHSFPTD